MKVEENINIPGIYFWESNGIVYPFFSINGTRHSFYFDSVKIKIGCLRYTIDYWLKHYEEIGKKFSYTSKQIQEYFKYIKYADKKKQEYLQYIKSVQKLQVKK